MVNFFKFKTIIFLIILFAFFSLAKSALAAASITGISGTVSDGQNITISGSGFGPNQAISKIEWLGSNIEQGANGNDVSLPAGWTSDPTSSSSQSPKYTSARAHSGTKSILSSLPVQTQYDSGLRFDNGGPISSVYFTWWVYIDNLSCGGSCAGNSQWKIFRLTPGIGGIYLDQKHNMLWSQQVAAPSATFSGGNYMLTNYCLADDYPSYDSNCFAGEYPGGPSGIYRPNGIVENRWYRIEGWAVQSSPGAQDGTLHIDIFDQSNTARPFVAYDGTVRTRSASTPSWQYLVWQNYLGNGLEQGNIYQDDFFIQFGSRARVELCAESTWSGRKHCEIQIPSAWSANAITLTVNKASFTSGQTAYLYVVDSSGNVNSSGYLVTIGSGGGTPPPADTTPPAPPTGLKVQ